MRALFIFLALTVFRFQMVAAPGSVDFQAITTLLVANGCDEQNVHSDRVSLNKKSKSSDDLMVFCDSDCGAQQCSYSIYRQNQERYMYSGQFFGHYKILQTWHKGFFDIQVSAKSASGETTEKLLKLKGTLYQ